jgi:hypothetical protein
MVKADKPKEKTKKSIRKASEVTFSAEVLGKSKSSATRKSYDTYIRKLWEHLEYEGEYKPENPFPAEGLTDESLAKD